ncbi:hypothetical protein FH972_023080 [Carpinus fangiana]|uniref:Enoyl reductase (ER) domain-containing protein n=1 Tax=Carpinus fangiana TaxID=176857 RepID=A0A5N6KUR2_9ROSI|nr:hypothetical protein FH972_023080 [Carpinus fangiana]
MAALPETMKAIKTRYKGVAEIEPAAKFPCKPDQLPDTYILIKTSHVALNPTDWKHIDFLGPPNHTVGCDVCGTVVAVGAKVTKAYKPGDRAAGAAHGVKLGCPEKGAFGEYALLKGDVTIKVPAGISDAEASTVGVGITTVGQALYQTLGLPWPDQSDAGVAGAAAGDAVLVYGGSTATGLFALQLAKLSGLRVLTTCSPKNFDLVKEFGADEAFDYSKGEGCSAAISAAAGGKLLYAFDCISTGASAKICADALSKTAAEGQPRPHYTSLIPLEFPRDDVKSGYTLAYTVNGEPFEFRDGKKVPDSPEDFKFGVKFWAVVEKLIAEKKLKLFPTVKEGGFEGVLQGLELLRKNKVSGQKLVYKIGSDA